MGFCIWFSALLLVESCELTDEAVALELGSVAFVAMVKPTDLGERHDFALVGSLSRAR